MTDTATTTAPTPTLTIARLRTTRLWVPIRGLSPLITHNFSAKAKQQMLDNMQGRKRVKEPRDPDADYQSGFYKIFQPDGSLSYGFPAIGFKAATVSAARFYDKSVTMTALRQVLFFEGVRTEGDPQELVEINGTPHMREDMVRLGLNSTDLRYRPEFTEWTAVLRVKFIESSIDKESVLALINAGGLGVGVGEWRPEKSGQYGQFEIDPDEEIGVEQ